MVLTVNVKTVHLFLLIFSLYQCTSGQPQHHRFIQVRDGVDQQRKYLDQWDRLLALGEITVTMENNNPLYRFTGPNVQQMTVKEVFIMLQNWLRRIPEVQANNEETILDRTHRFIEMNIGGNDFRFRLYPDNKNKHILFATENNRMTAYTDVAEIIDSNEDEVQMIAELMLESSEQPLNSQSHWPHSGNNRPRPEIENFYKIIKKIKDKKKREQAIINKLNEFKSAAEREKVRKVLKELEVEDKMRELMILGQVAEAARPTDDGYTALKNVMIKVWSSEIIDEDKTLQKEIEEIFKKREYGGSDATSVLDDIEFRKLARNIANQDHDNIVEFMQELPNEYPPKLREELVKTVISVIIGTTSNEGEMWQREIKKIFNKRKYSKFDAKPVLEQTKFRELARKIVKHRTDSTAELMQELPDKYSSELREELAKTAISVIREVKERAKTRFDRGIKGLRPKHGRIPGEDETFRDVLSKIAEGAIKSFREAFDKHFINTKKGGLQEARKRLFSDVGTTIERPTKRQNVDIVAARDATLSTIMEQVEVELRPLCGPGFRKKRQTCSHQRQNLMIVEESVRLIGDTIHFEVISEEGKRQGHEIAVDLEKLPLAERTEEYIENLERSGLHEEKKTNKVGTSHVQGFADTALGVHGAIVNIFATINYFSQDDFGKGVFTAAQAAHGIGSLIGVNDVVSKATRIAFEKAFEATVDKVGLKTTVERVSEVGAKALGETASRTLSRFASSVPLVGLAFDAKFIADDIEEFKEVDSNSSLPKGIVIAHLVLDIGTTVLTLIESIAPPTAPFVAPAILAITFARLAIDDFYLDIKEELSKVEGKGFLAKFIAFEKGYYEGLWDAVTLGVGRQLRELHNQLNYDRQLLHNLSNPVSYFNVTFQGRGSNGEEVGTVDFTAGILSDYGGFLTLTMNDNGSFTVEFPEVPTKGGGTVPIKQTFSFDHPVSDVVLGIGQVRHPVYTHREAKLWLVIKVDSADVIDRFEDHQSSQYGTYYGNSHDNNFYALQANNNDRKKRFSNERTQKRSKRQSESNCPSSKLTNFTVQLQSYHYDLYGRDGNDNFFLGLQSSRVAGGNDNDFYHIPSTGGKAIINNFAHDEEMDTLFLDVDFADIFCARDNWDLIIGYCQTHAVQIENWFSHGAEEFYRHLHVSTADGVVIDVAKSDLDVDNFHTSCAAVSVDKSRSSTGVIMTLTGIFSEVKIVHGSNYSDTIIGNDKPNTLNGGLGYDYMEGGNGTDIYVVEEDSGSKIINNFAVDNIGDLLYIGIPYIDLTVEIDDINLTLNCSSSNDTRVKLMSWFSGYQWQHMTFISSDYIMFTVNEDDTGMAKKHPLTINLGENENGVLLDLMHPENSENITINSEIAFEVKTVIDTPHNDQIVGNMLGNFFLCSGGSDFLQGNGGKDTYKIDNTCKSATIDNFDEAGNYDLMLLACPSSSVNLQQSSEELVIVCTLSQGKAFGIYLKQWFNSTQYQHMMIKTLDKITAFLPESITELQANNGRLFPVQIEKDEDCGGEHREIDLSQLEFSKCERLVAKTDACSYSVIGNSLKNYIDPGPGNPYGYQHLMGANGTDAYVIGHRYGVFNIIDNYAEDGQYDHLFFEVLFHDIEVTRSGNDIYLSSLSSNDSVRVRISNYFLEESYQHLLVHSADDVLFKFTSESPYIEVILIDYSTAVYSQIINADDNSTFEGARVIVGSRVAENYIRGGSNTTKITGGNVNDTIIGGPGGEDLFGGDGDDIIYGGQGNDVLYGGDGNDILDGGAGDDILYAGMGADVINGSSGTNTVIFSGYNFTGVIVDLQVGLGWDADAEGDSYSLISNIVGSSFDDTLIGNDLDNTIRGHGGDDFIYPAGGDDILQGGRGADQYYLNDAFGHKLIDNFATDNTLDIIVANKSSWEDACFHFFGDDLQINFDFGEPNITRAFARLMLNEALLMVTLASWLENSTYQHIGFIFEDGYKSFEDYQNTTHQIQPAVDIIYNDTLFEITGVYETEIDLLLYYDDLMDTDIATSNDVNLYLAHFQLESDSNAYYPLSLLPSSITRNMRLENITAGTQHSLFLVLSSCGLTVAVSPLVLATTIPSPPAGVIIVETFSDGFYLEWTAPANNTNPLVDYYTVTVSSEAESFVYYSIVAEFSVYNLIPETTYLVSICHTIYNVTSNCSSVSVSTAENDCSNLQNLPPRYLIGEFQRNAQGEIVAFVSCDNEYQLAGDHRVVCNDTESRLPQCSMITCQIPFVPHAEKIMGPNTPRHTESVHWHCHSDYWISVGVSNFSSVCLEGVWQPPLQNCTEKPSCLQLTPPEHGRMNSTARHVNDVVFFSCNMGYILQGPREKTCTLRQNHTAVWLPAGEVTCHALECTLPSISNATILSEISDPSHGDTVLWGCNGGYWVSYGREDFNSTCFAGSWSPPLESCTERPTCPSLTSPQNGSINSTVFYVGDAVAFTCDLGYARDGPEVKTCRFNETTNTTFWSPGDGVNCHALECSLPSISNATILMEVSDPSHGDTVEWSCQNDYWVRFGVTEFSSTCSAGTWDPPVQSCTEKPTCTVPSIPQNGSVNSIATIFHVDDVILYTCDFGYTLQGTADKQCALNKTDGTTYWSPSSDVDCSVIECTLPVISNARLLSGRRESNPIHGDTVFWGCQDSYWIRNGVTEFSSTCLAGSWTSALQNCTRKPRCSSPTVPEHGEINSTASNFYVDDAVSFSCDLGYNLEGPAEKQCRYVAIFWGFSFWSPGDQVNCIALQCSLPSIINADKQRGSSNPRHGDTAEWSCQRDYWVGRGVTEFNSTCSAGSWDPPVQNCMEKPRCPAPLVPGNGSTNSTASVFHVDDTISYSCNSGYSHQGVEVQSCFYDGNTTYWSPYGDAYCNAMQCPDLLPQPNGHYSPATSYSQHYYTGDTVELVCDPGYYARDHPSHPETAQLRCLGTDWSPSQMHCRVILQVAVSTLYINRADGHVWYGITSLENTSVPSNLYEFACDQMIGEHSSYEYIGRATRYRTVYRVRHYFEGWTFRTRVVTQLVPYSVIVLRCNTQLLIADGPTMYDGILAIHTRNGVEKVCIEESSDARSVCIHLGYEEYTTFHYQVNSAYAIQTTLAFNASSDIVTNSTKSCLHRINCRQRCLVPSLSNGNVSTCLNSYEGHYCIVRCNPGYALLGSPVLMCKSSGIWSPVHLSWIPNSEYHPECDGEKWEADLDREIRTHRSWRRYRLADYLRDYLRDHYPGVCWVVIVYNDVSGFPKHTVQGYNYYHRFQYYGHNVVVSRIIPGPSVRTPDNLETILTRSYRKRPDCCRSYDYETGVIYPIDPWCHLFCILDAERTNHDTWDVLLQRVSPVMLHVVRDGISIASSWTANAEGYVVSRYIDGGFVTLLARQ